MPEKLHFFKICSYFFGIYLTGYLFSAYYISGTILGADNISMNLVLL